MNVYFKSFIADTARTIVIVRLPPTRAT